MAGKFEEALEMLKERFGDEASDISEALEGYKGSELRKKAERADAAEQRVVELEREVRKARTAPKVIEALTNAGVDLEALRPLERKAVESLDFDGDEPSEEWVAKIVSDGGFPMVEGAGEPGEEPPAARIAAHAKGAPAGGGRTSGVITPETITNWPRESRRRFSKEHPEAWDALGRGETVSGIAFTP